MDSKVHGRRNIIYIIRKEISIVAMGAPIQNDNLSRTEIYEQKKWLMNRIGDTLQMVDQRRMFISQ
jgi:hypothetical protein